MNNIIYEYFYLDKAKVDFYCSDIKEIIRRTKTHDMFFWLAWDWQEYLNDLRN